MSIPLFKSFHSTDIEEKAVEVLRSGFIASGEYISKFEQSFSYLVDIGNVLSINNMTNAIYLALHLSGVKNEDEVIATPFSCLSTTSAIAAIGATVNWVDLEQGSVSICVESFEKAITPKTKAAIVYHIAGYPSNIHKIYEICQKYGISLIEDCNAALLSQLDNNFVGRTGDFSVFSFYPNRQINATEGAAICCKKSVDYHRALKLRRYGIDVETFRDAQGEINPKSDVPEIGWNLIMNNLCSAIGSTQMESSQHSVAASRRNAAIYNEYLSSIIDAKPIVYPENANPNYWVYIIDTAKKEIIRDRLKEFEISSSSLHLRNDLYSGFNSSRKYPSLTGVDYASERLLALPCGFWMTEKDIISICNIISDI